MNDNNAVLAAIFAIGSSLAGLTQFELPAKLGVLTKGPVTMSLAQISAHAQTHEVIL